MYLGVELLSQGHEYVLIAKHTTLEVDNIARILAQPPAEKKNLCMLIMHS